jgi:hypothetical protein
MLVHSSRVSVLTPLRSHPGPLKVELTWRPLDLIPIIATAQDNLVAAGIKFPARFSDIWVTPVASMTLVLERTFEVPE